MKTYLQRAYLATLKADFLKIIAECLQGENGLFKKTLTFDKEDKRREIEEIISDYGDKKIKIGYVNENDEKQQNNLKELYSAETLNLEEITSVSDWIEKETHYCYDMAMSYFVDDPKKLEKCKLVELSAEDRRINGAISTSMHPLFLVAYYN